MAKIMTYFKMWIVFEKNISGQCFDNFWKVVKTEILVISGWQSLIQFNIIYSF